MKLLLTSGGIKNESIKKALIGLLGKPISDCSALCIPTAIYPSPVGAEMAWKFVAGQSANPMCELGWKSLGILELTALPSIKREVWLDKVLATDALLVYGGDALFLSYWMEQSGLADIFPLLDHITYVGLSSGSMVLTPNVGEEFVDWQAPSGTYEALGVVDFSIFPHLDHEKFPENAMEFAEEWAGKLQFPSYAIDDQSAIQVVDGKVDLISEGHWKHFPR